MTAIFQKPYHNYTHPDQWGNQEKCETKDDYIGAILYMLSKYTLDGRRTYKTQDDSYVHMVTHGERFEAGKLVYLTSTLPHGVIALSGQLQDFSWGFTVYTDDDELIAKISDAMAENFKRDDFEYYERDEIPCVPVGGEIEEWAGFFEGNENLVIFN